MNDRLQEIKEKIRTVNPAITDELLDLLCEYVKEANMPKGGGSLPHYTPYPQYYPDYYPHTTYPSTTCTYGGSGGGQSITSGVWKYVDAPYMVVELKQ